MTQLLILLVCTQLSGGVLEGVWTTDFGRLEIVQRDGVLTGTYPNGTLSSGRLESDGWYFQYQDAESTGLARFRVEGARLIGSWRTAETDPWKEWNGRRMPTGIEGAWSTNFGPLKIIAQTDGWHGLYADGTLTEGRKQGDAWHFRYVEGDTKGHARFRVKGNTLTGSWRVADTDDWKPWTGTRTEPADGPYLIILEAPWESGFGERPYAFASMLKSHFQMTDQVTVRSMQVHDSKDIERACRHVALMTAPVYLLMSSHGTPRGLTMNDATIPATAFRDLKYCEGLKLLHLSGCSMMNGGHFQEIRDVAGGHFPISGYKIDVPWAASALSDYFYLTQIFVHGASPEDAVRRTHKLIPYSHKTAVLPEYPAMGLSIR